MEQRLKKQRNRLCVRVSLILLCVYLAASCAFGAALLYSEKTSVHTRELSRLSSSLSKLSETSKYDAANLVYLTLMDMISTEDGRRDWDTQIIVSDIRSDFVLIDSAGRDIVKFGIQWGIENNSLLYGYIDYGELRGLMTEEQYKRICAELSEKRTDGRSCELICTRFHADDNSFELVPLELQVALCDSENAWFSSDEIIDTITLRDASPDADVYVCNTMQRNIIPKEPLTGEIDPNNSDYIGLLSDEQRGERIGVFPAGMFTYISYASDSVVIRRYGVDENDLPATADVTYKIEYAKRIDLIKICASRLAAGCAVILLFFVTTDVIICLMIGKMVGAQIVQEKRRTELTNALAHDIKTPLFVISGCAYSLKENIDSGGRDEYLGRIIDQTDEINSLVHKMLELSKLDSSAMTLVRTDFDLYELVSEITGKLPALSKGKTLTVTHSGENMINGDRELLKTAVQNLIDNAVKYSLKGSGITVDVTGNTLTISNECEPLSKAELKQIWQPYFRKDKSRHKEGNGLGLSIVRSIFDLHGVRCDMQMKDTTLVCKTLF